MTTASPVNLIIKSSTWTGFHFGFVQLLRLTTNIVLAAILFEEAFALMAITIAVSQGLNMFSDFGLNQSVIHDKDGSDRLFLDTIWLIQINRGVCLFFIMLMLAKPVSIFYSEGNPAASDLYSLIIIISFSALFEGFRSTNYYSAKRNLNIGRLMCLEMVATLVGAVSMMLLAANTGSVYSLALGSVSGSLIVLIGSHMFLLGEKNKLRFHYGSAKKIFRFGKWIFLSTCITFLSLQLDRLLFAKLFSLDQVGVYSIALALAYLGYTLVSSLASTVALPVYSKATRSKGSVLDEFKAVTRCLLLAGAFITSGLVVCGPTFIELAYDERYSKAMIYLPILSFGAWLAVIRSNYINLLLSQGLSKWTSAASAGKVIGLCIVVFPLSNRYGFIGAVISVVFSEATMMCVAAVGVVKQRLPVGAIEILFTAYLLLVCFLSYELSNHLFGQLSVSLFTKLVIQISFVCFAFCIAAYFNIRLLKDYVVNRSEW